MIGIDLTSISRFKGKEEKFAKRILSSEEKKLFKECKDKTQFIATRWALKEAIFKADNKMLEFSKINIKKENDKYINKGFQLSTSKEEDIIIAIAMKEKTW